MHSTAHALMQALFEFEPCLLQRETTAHVGVTCADIQLAAARAYDITVLREGVQGVQEDTTYQCRGEGSPSHDRSGQSLPDCLLVS